MPETMPFWVESLNGLVMPRAPCESVVLLAVLFMLVAVTFEARFTDDCPVWFMSFFPAGTAFSAGIVLFMLATRLMRVWPITDESSLALAVV